MYYAYYNEFDLNAAAWLREMIKQGLIMDGEVDTRSIVEVQPEDLRGFTRVHLFAGIGGWDLALQIANWPLDREVWSGSCPCQSFSNAGKQKGKNDARHLWPEMYRLIGQCAPATVFGEQVEGAIRHLWLDDLHTDLEAQGYATGFVVCGAHSIGGFHQRQRLYWMGDTSISSQRAYDGQSRQSDAQQVEIGGSDLSSGLADSRTTRLQEQQRHTRISRQTDDGIERQNIARSGGLGDAEHKGSSSRQEQGSNAAPVRNGATRTNSTGELEGTSSPPFIPLVNTDSNRREPWCETATLDRYWDTVDAASWAGIGLGNTEYQRRNTNPVGGQIAGITKERWLRELERSSSDIEWLYCRDDKHRPIKRGTPPLVNGLPRGVVPSSYQGMEINADNTAEARIMRLKGYGNAIVPTVAAEFIATFVDYDGYGKLI